MCPSQLGDLRLGLEEDALLDVAALGVGPVELVGDSLRSLGVLGQDELEPGVRALQAAGRVDARRQPEADRGRVEPRRVHARDAHERPQAGLARRRERAQPIPHEPAVLAGQLHHVGHGGQRHKVQVLGRGRRAQRLRELQRHAGGAQVRARVAAQRRVDDGRVGQAAVRTRRVVVGHDDVHARRARRGDLVDRRDGAVGGHQQGRAARRQALHRARVEPVAVLQAARQVPVGVAAQRAQRAHEDRRRADAVGVVVAVDGDRRTGLQVLAHDGHRRVDAGEGVRRMRLVGRQPRPRGGRVGEPAPHQHLRDDVADAELDLQPRHRLGRAGGNVETARGGGHGAARSYGPDRTDTLGA